VRRGDRGTASRQRNRLWTPCEPSRKSVRRPRSVSWPRSARSVFEGIGGRVQPESVADLDRNGWTVSGAILMEGQRQVEGGSCLAWAPVGVIHAGIPDLGERLAVLVRERVHPDGCLSTGFTPVMGTHTGPGLFGVGYLIEQTPHTRGGSGAAQCAALRTASSQRPSRDRVSAHRTQGEMSRSWSHAPCPGRGSCPRFPAPGPRARQQPRCTYPSRQEWLE